MVKVLAASVLLAAAAVGIVWGMRWLSEINSPATLASHQRASQKEQTSTAKPPVEKMAETPPPSAKPSGREVSAEKPAAGKPPIYEVFPEKPAAPKTRAADSDTLHAAIPPAPIEPPAPLKKRPRVAIIIDDLGYDRQIAEKFMDLNAPITLAVLPHSPHQETIAQMAHTRNIEVMLHLPMEPVEFPEINPGPGALLSSMAADELLAVLEKNLRSVPHIRGVNNHMGSRLTAQSEQMYQVFSTLKRHGMYFIDSRTTDESVCRPSARLFQVAFNQRDVFLDHIQSADFIRKQLRELVSIARRKGEAVGIGHPHPTTCLVLKEELPTLRRQVEIVPASYLVRVIE